jgi:DMSO reductase family type II enzyme heme b subunit
LVLPLLGVAGCKKTPPPVNEVVAVSSARLPLDPNDSAWEGAPEHVAKLIPQDLVEPRLMKPSTPEVGVRALANGSEIAFRLHWVDPVKNDLPGAGRFIDACAVQLPKNAEKEPPDPQMGETQRPVEITFWRADWQASLAGRGDTIQDLYPNASIDHYPFEAPSLEKGSAAQKEMAARYAPAEVVRNRRTGPRETAVENLVAEGPGTLAPAPLGTSKGYGIHIGDGWAVVLSRKLPEGLAPQTRTQIAFAIWEGSQQEAGARKMRTGWIPLSLREAK